MSKKIVSELSKSKFFSKLDLTKGYYQIPVAECDRDKTAFVTWESQYRFLTMPFGLQNAGAIFTRLMKKYLKMKNMLSIILMTYSSTLKLGVSM